MQPRLRFNAFKAPWKPQLLNTYIESIQSGKSTDRCDFGSYPLYGSTGAIGLTDRAEYFGTAILIARVGANAGTKYLVKGKYSVTDNTLILKLKDSGDYLFFSFLLEWKKLNKLAFGSGQPLITGGLLKQLTLNLPELPEQTKIASFLSAVDEKITHLTKKYKLLTQYKKGMMQKIFSQELRFKADDGTDYPDWKLVFLGEISSATTGSSNRVDSTLDGEYTFFDRSEDIRTSDKYLFDTEAVIVAGEGQSFKPKFFTGKFDLHQRAYAVMNFKNSSAKYIYYYMDFFKNYFLSKAVGSTVKSLRLPMFNEMPINLPNIIEQNKIANFLSAIDDKIQNTQSQLEATKQYKQGLLQQMFV